jgi:hypothetical protein
MGLVTEHQVPIQPCSQPLSSLAEVWCRLETWGQELFEVHTWPVVRSWFSPLGSQQMAGHSAVERRWKP